MASEAGFNAYTLWREIENDQSPENLQRAYKELLVETEGRTRSEQEMQVFYYLAKLVK